MKTNKKMDLKNLEDELMVAKYNYHGICDINFAPISEHTYFDIAIFITLSVVIVFWIVLETNIPSMFQGLICMGFFGAVLISCDRYLHTRKKFSLSNFSEKDLLAIKSDQFLCYEFKKHLIDNDTSVSSEFSKIAQNYRNELKDKIERLSNLKERLEREILIKSMQ